MKPNIARFEADSNAPDSRADLQRVGGVGDSGIDGVISLDRLGLEKVYVQAKRWQGSVGRPDVQGFYGALAGQRANKGVFITTSMFSSQALEFVRSVERVERIVLIDGAKLAEPSTTIVPSASSSFRNLHRFHPWRRSTGGFLACVPASNHPNSGWPSA